MDDSDKFTLIIPVTLLLKEKIKIKIKQLTHRKLILFNTPNHNIRGYENPDKLNMLLQV